MNTVLSFAPPRLLARERAHRRSVMLSLVLLFLFGTSPVFGHHVTEPLTSWLAGRDHLLSICIIALHELMAPVHGVFHILLGLGAGCAIFDRVRAMFHLRMTLRLLDHEVAAPRGAIARAARAVGVDPRHIRVLRRSRVPAFTAGLLDPVIYVAGALAARLTPAELEAVIAHEDAHRRRRDPLRLSAWRFAACTLFFLPALRRLVEDMADEAEIAADDEAALRPGVQPLALASALVSIAQQFRPDPALATAAVGFAGRDLLDRRVRRLAGEDAPVATHVTRSSLAGAGAALASAWISGLLVAHPLPAVLPSGAAGLAAHGSEVGTEHHCTHAGAWAFSHLFCLGSAHRSAPGTDCPHADRRVPAAP